MIKSSINKIMKYCGYICIVTVLLLMACKNTAPIVVTPATVEELVELAIPGVDSLIMSMARDLSQESFVPPVSERQADSLIVASHTLIAVTDSLLSPQERYQFPLPATDTTSTSSRNASIVAFNTAAALLQQYAQEGATSQTAAILARADSLLVQAVRLNPFDDEARLWLARVIEMQAANMDNTARNSEAIRHFQRLVELHQDRHDYVAYLAAAVEREGTEEAGNTAGVLWQRASTVAQDDALLSPDPARVADSAAVFNYLARAGRAYIQGNNSAGAMESLTSAGPWSTSPETDAFLDGERAWVRWDNGNLLTRKKWDDILALSATDPAEAVQQARALLPNISRNAAGAEVRHHAALLEYTTGETTAAITALQSLWHTLSAAPLSDTALTRRIGEDYSTLAYNLGQEHRDSAPEMALGYFLQAETLGGPVAARASIQVALLLKNNLSAALEAALRAESQISSLTLEEKRQLYRFLLDLHRRAGDRDGAARYIEKFRALAGE